MSILVNKDTKVLIQGMTGKEGTIHAKGCIDYGTNVVAGVTPNKGGTTHLGVPVFNTVREAIKETGADCSLIFVPPPFAADAIIEAADAGMKLIICITEGIPVRDMVNAKRFIDGKGITLIGPNCPGILSANECKAGIMPGNIFKKGKAGVISRSGTLVYEIVDQLTKAGVGETTCAGLGGDPVVGTKYNFWLEQFQNDPETKAVVMVGEIGGDDEVTAADYIKNHMTKPVIAFIAGRTAPKGKRMGHAGAIVTGIKATADYKMKALRDAGAIVVENPALIGKAVAKALL